MKVKFLEKGQISEEMHKAGIEMLSKEFSVVKKEFYFKDLFGFNMGGDTCEIEVKVADYDFYKEFNKATKKSKHNKYRDMPEICPSRFYFMVPANLYEKAIRKIMSNRWYCNYGLLVYCHVGKKIHVVKKSERLSSTRFKGDVITKPFAAGVIKNIND